MVRLLLADVTFTKVAESRSSPLQRSHKTGLLALPVTARNSEERNTGPEVVAEIDRLRTIIMIRRSLRSSTNAACARACGQQFNSRLVGALRHEYRSRPRYDRLREKGC